MVNPARVVRAAASTLDFDNYQQGTLLGCGEEGTGAPLTPTLLALRHSALV